MYKITRDIILDVNNPSTQGTITIPQGTAHVYRLAMHITAGGHLVDLSDCLVQIKAVKPDSTEIYGNCDIVGDTAYYIVQPQFAAAVGYVDCQVEISEMGATLYTPKFRCIVSSGVGLKNITSSSDYKAFQSYMNNAATLINTAKGYSEKAASESSWSETFAEDARGYMIAAEGHKNAAATSESNASASAESAKDSEDAVKAMAEDIEQTKESIDMSIYTHNTSGDAHDDIRTEIRDTAAVARGKARSKTFATKADMDAWLAIEENAAGLNTGDNLYIVQLGVPDYWWSKEDGCAYELGAEKPDFSDYYTKSETDEKASIINSGILAAEAAKNAAEAAKDSAELNARRAQNFSNSAGTIATTVMDLKESAKTHADSAADSAMLAASSAASAATSETNAETYAQSAEAEAAKLFNRVMNQSDFDDAESLDAGIYFVKLGV